MAALDWIYYISSFIGLAMILEINRIIRARNSRNPSTWSLQFQCQVTAYILVLLFLPTNTAYAAIGYNMELTENKLQKLTTPPPIELLWTDVTALILFYLVTNITMYASLDRFLRISRSKTNFMKFGKIVSIIYTFGTLISTIFTIEIFFGPRQGCKWQASTTEFCQIYGMISKKIIHVSIGLVYPFLEMIMCFVLIQDTFPSSMKSINKNNLISRINQQKFYLYSWIVLIISIDVLTCAVYLTDSFLLSQIALNVSMIHVWASFEFLGQLRVAIELAKENTSVSQTNVSTTFFDSVTEMM